MDGSTFYQAIIIDDVQNNDIIYIEDDDVDMMEEEIIAAPLLPAPPLPMAPVPVAPAVRVRPPNLTRATENYEEMRHSVETLPSFTANGTRSLSGSRILTMSINPDAGLGCTLASVHSKLHYEEEMRMGLEDGMQWDQPMERKEQAEAGHLAAFVMTAGDHDKMEIFRIVRVGGPEGRRDEWNVDTPEHQGRGVVYLSEYLGWCSSTTYANSVAGVPVVTGNSNAGKMSTKNGTQVYAWSESIAVYVP